MFEWANLTKERSRYDLLTSESESESENIYLTIIHI